MVFDSSRKRKRDREKKKDREMNKWIKKMEKEKKNKE